VLLPCATESALLCAADGLAAGEAAEHLLIHRAHKLEIVTFEGTVCDRLSNSRPDGLCVREKLLSETLINRITITVFARPLALLPVCAGSCYI
jgi:hypothetical protein